MKKHTKITLFRPTILGFFVVYLISMLFVTDMMKEKFEKNFEDKLGSAADSFLAVLLDKEVFYGIHSEEDKEQALGLARYYLSSRLDYTQKYNKISGAIYDADGDLLTKADSLFGPGPVNATHGGQINLSYPLYDYFTEQEMNEMLNYYDCSIKALKNEQPDPYAVKLSYDTKTLVPTYIFIIERQYETEEQTEKEGLYRSKPKLIAERKVWEWSNSDWKENVRPIYEASGNGIPTWSYEMDSLSEFLVLPYYRYYGRNHWKQWEKEGKIQEFSKKYHNINDTMTYSDIQSSDSDSKTMKEGNDYVIWSSNAEFDKPYHSCKVLIKNNPQPYLAAMDYMKYIYLSGFFLMACSLFFVLKSMKNAYIKQQQLNQSKQDFINAIAHELKTPLGIIRGFSENIKEQTVVSKENYYLEKMKEQTYVMEHLVDEIMDITKLDANSIILKKETISLDEIVKEQTERLFPLIQKKHITICEDILREFIILGDRGYLGRAIFNLLENAVSYNQENGVIRIRITKDLLEIENTGKPIKKEDMPYIFDLFYTSDKSRTSVEKHFGLGLYLAKKICSMHQLILELANTDFGVKVSVRKGAHHEKELS